MGRSCPWRFPAKLDALYIGCHSALKTLIAITGQVKRPGVFELPADRHPIALDEGMALAGGPVWAGPTRALRLTSSPEGTEVPNELADGAGHSLSDGHLLMVSPIHDVRV